MREQLRAGFIPSGDKKRVSITLLSYLAMECTVAGPEDPPVVLVSFPEAGCVDPALRLTHETNNADGEEWQQRVTAESEVVSMVGKNADGRNHVDMNTCKVTVRLDSWTG